MEERTSRTLEELFSLEGRVGVVTGASSGIGKQIALLITDAGARVFDLSLVLDHEPNDRIVRKQIDITDTKALKETIDEIGKDGIDFLVNNAGITKRARAGDVDASWWRKIHDVNTDALFFASQYAYPYLKQSKTVGRIINISSMAAYMGFSEVVPYCSSKSAVTGITRGLAVEWAMDNILVNSVSPGWFRTDMNSQVVDADRDKKILSKIALGRYGRVRDIAQMVLFLLSDAATYITGQDFSVDGGARAFGY